MDTAFYSRQGVYRWDDRCRIVADLGFDATYLTLWNDLEWSVHLPRAARARAEYGIDVAAVYVTLDLSDESSFERVQGLVRSLEGVTTIELAIADRGTPPWRSHGPNAEVRMRWLERLLEDADRRDLTISLYPHTASHLESAEHAAAICSSFESPRLRMTLSLFHTLLADGSDIAATARACAPYVAAVNVCGIRSVPNAPRDEPPLAIDRVGVGEVNPLPMLAALRAAGFDGPVGIQGWSVGGDARSALGESLAALRTLLDRADAGEGGDLAPPVPWLS
jgi:sugar phosphate isomerase/epimerase